MIEVKNIYKTYPTLKGRNVVLDNASIKFADRQSMGILGRNGAGKSTLLRIVAGIEQADGGEVIRTGRISWPIGFGGGFSPSLNGEENSRFVARVYGEDVDRVVEATREFADLGSYFYMPIRTYSSGMRARLAFGLSMAVDFDIYLVDEVIAVGDVPFQEKCRRAFEERRGRSSVIIVSHSLDTIRSYCSQCAVLHAGKLTVFSSVEEAAKMYEEVSA
jgi:capsular polysaccharide transport system ATP-binding protein